MGTRLYNSLKWLLLLLPRAVTIGALHKALGPIHKLSQVADMQPDVWTMEYPTESVLARGRDRNAPGKGGRGGEGEGGPRLATRRVTALPARRAACTPHRPAPQPLLELYVSTEVGVPMHTVRTLYNPRRSQRVVFRW